MVAVPIANHNTRGAWGRTISAATPATSTALTVVT